MLTGRLVAALGALALTAGAALAESPAAEPSEITGHNRIDAQRPDAPALAAYGSHKIGVRTIELTHADQINIAAIDPEAETPDPLPTYDRELTVEVWYPAADDASGETSFPAYIRDGETEVTLYGRAMRGAAPADGNWPLVIISHGYPGNRYLLSHLAENLASKGYIVASIDHPDSIYQNKVAFGSTLVNRPLDQRFVLGEIARLGGEDGFLGGIVNASNAALIGYSMGGYGAVITAGGGVTPAGVDLSWGAPHGTLAVNQSGSATHQEMPDPRFKTAIAVAPWGWNQGFWDEETLTGVELPMLFIAGSVDDVAGYDPGVRSIWEASTGTDRALLTFEDANHNAAAPYPAPNEGREVDPDLGFAPFDHYADAVWDTVRMNNIFQHFATAWLDSHLKGDEEAATYLDLVPNSNDGVWSREDDGTKADDDSYWKGFQNRTAKGLRYEVLEAEE